MENAWSPKRTPPRAYDAPNRPWWKLADILAAHKGEKSWTHAIVRNRDLEADWRQMAAGQRTEPLMYADNATALIVWGGQLRVSIRSEEHTSELQSLMRISYAVFCLKKTNKYRTQSITTHNHTTTTK